MRTIMIAAALALLASAPVHAQKIDKNGRCHDKAGKFAKAEVCSGAGTALGGAVGAGPTSASGPAPGYKLDAKGKCHDPKGKMAKKALCAA